jgi:hypothetical protein
MENEASKTRSLNIAFHADTEGLESLERVLSELKGAQEYQVRFSDGSTVKYLDVKDIVAQPNSGRRFIVAVIASVEGRAGHSAFVTVRDDPEPSVEYTINGPQKDVIYFADKLDDWIASCRQWYSPFFSTLGVVPVVAAIILPLYLAARISKVFPAKTGPLSLLPLLVMIVVGLAEYWICKLFPRGTFAIGYGAKRHQRFTFIRNSVLVAFALSLVASVLANWLTQH